MKSKLNPEKLKEALENCRSVRRLQISHGQSSLDEYCWRVLGKAYVALNVAERGQVRRRYTAPTYIFSYRGYANRLQDFVSTLRSKVAEIGGGNYQNEEFDLLPDVVCAEGCAAILADGNMFNFPGTCALNEASALVHPSFSARA